MSTPKYLMLWALALTPFAMAVVAHRHGNSPTLSISPRALPALAFDQYLVDLGPIQPTAEVHANFLFRHRGANPVQIVELKPSCGCLQPRLKKTEYQPGDVDALVLRVQPANEAPGKHEYTVDISYRDPEPRETRVTFRVELPEKGISITPPAVMVYQFSERETVQPIMITDTRGEGWSVEGVSTNLNFVNIDVEESRRAEDGTFQQPLQITVAAKIPHGRHRGLIRVFTTDANYPELRIPLMIQGPEAIDDGDAKEEHTSP